MGKLKLIVNDHYTPTASRAMSRPFSTYYYNGASDNGLGYKCMGRASTPERATEAALKQIQNKDRDIRRAEIYDVDGVRIKQVTRRYNEIVIKKI